MKNKQITAILIGIFLISLVGAVEIYSGDSVTLTLPEEYSYYSIVGNNTPIDLEIEQTGLDVTITIGKYTQTDSFELVFFNKEKEIIHHYSSGGSSSTKTIYKNVTEYIEVDNYIDREVIVYTEDEIEEVEEEKPISLFWGIFIIILGILILFGFIFYCFKRSQE